MRKQWFIAAGLVGFFIASEPALVLARGTDPTAALAATLDEGKIWLFNLVSIIGGVVGLIVGLFCYMGWLPKHHFKAVLVLTVMIVIIPQVIQFIFDTAGFGT